MERHQHSHRCDALTRQTNAKRTYVGTVDEKRRKKERNNVRILFTRRRREPWGQFYLTLYAKHKCALGKKCHSMSLTFCNSILALKTVHWALNLYAKLVRNFPYKASHFTHTQKSSANGEISPGSQIHQHF